ncbi:MAG TPA: hypothetical protein VGC64_05655 [Pyrinomonadaceae bacterium]|jgi:acyl carrier protein
MENLAVKVSYDKESIFEDVTRILTGMMQDWDISISGPLTPDTRLIADLGFQSIDIVMMIGEIHRRYNRKNFSFERILLSRERPVDDLQISTIVGFLCEQLAQ